MNQYSVLAYYLFTPIEDPAAEVERHKQFFEGRDIKCRVYISQEGINGQLSAAAADGEAYMQWMMQDARFKEMPFKIHSYHEHVFPRATVKVRQQLVALNVSIDTKNGGEYVSPNIWSKMLEERDENTLLLDVRNDYEWEIGHFEGADLPPLEAFRNFPAYAEQLKDKHDPKTVKVMMYCTGGIRCELYSSLLKKAGFDAVYQLEGGVINYGQKEGQKHWQGKLFVFDDRLAVPLSEEEEADVISQCTHCEAPSDVYYNCANMDCNELFLCCPVCAEHFQGCCKSECQTAPRLRPYEKCDRPKPFRREHELRYPHVTACSIPKKVSNA